LLLGVASSWPRKGAPTTLQRPAEQPRESLGQQVERERKRRERERREREQHPSWYIRDSLGNIRKKRSERVQIAVSVDKPKEDGSQMVRLILSIDEGWHIYGNPVGLRELTSHQFEVTIKSKVPPKKVKIDYPAGKWIEDRELHLEWRISEGRVEVPITLWRDKGDDDLLEIGVRYCPLDNRTCGPPEHKALAVSLPRP
jgi:hypothetical protein